MKECDTCDGRGEILWNPLGGIAKLVKCLKCNGNGKVEDEQLD